MSRYKRVPVDIGSGRIFVPADTAAAVEAAFSGGMRFEVVNAGHAGNNRISGAISPRRADNGHNNSSCISRPDAEVGAP